MGFRGQARRAWPRRLQGPPAGTLSAELAVAGGVNSAAQPLQASAELQGGSSSRSGRHLLPRDSSLQSCGAAPPGSSWGGPTGEVPRTKGTQRKGGQAPTALPLLLPNGWRPSGGPHASPGSGH